MRRFSQTVLAVNVGGAIIPTLISIYLLSQFGHFFQAFIATLIVTLVVNQVARPVRGMGIAVPIFVLPLVAALVALLLGRPHTPK